MLNNHQVSQIKRLHEQGANATEIARTLGICRQTVSHYIKLGVDKAPLQKRSSKLDVLNPELVIERYKNYEESVPALYRQMEEEPHFYGLKDGCNFSLRALQGFIYKHHLAEQKEFGKDVKRPFHCLPGHQIQIDFTERYFKFDGSDEETKIYIFEAVLAWSRNIYCCVFDNTEQSSWFEGIARAFEWLGVPNVVLCDNATSLIKFNNGQHYVVNPAFQFFCDKFGVEPKPCKPYKANTKGRVERAGYYIKHHCINYIQNTPSIVVYNLEDLQQEIDKWLISKYVLDRKFVDPRTAKRGGTPVRRTVRELYEYEKTKLRILEGDKVKLLVKVVRSSISFNGKLKFLGHELQIRDKNHWKTTASISIYRDGEYLVTTDGGATITKGKLDPKRIHDFEVSQKKRRAAKRAKTLPVEHVNAAEQGNDLGIETVLNEAEELSLSTEAHNTRRELDELLERNN